MKTSNYSDSQILGILKQNQAGVSVGDLCRQHGMSQATFYKWRARYGGMDASLMRRMKELEEENRRLKKMYAEERLISMIRQEALEGKL
jgi:putative transposase